MAAVLEQEDLSGATNQDAWKLMIVDDDQAVHQVTRMVLDDFEFEGKGLEFISAYSAKDALEKMEEHSDIALILLDVVMETDHAGLELARAIREDLRNHQVRIVLRTGEPGQAPEERVIVDYDINGYKEKTELTAQRLFTTVYAALRSYRDISVIERNKRGLEKVIESTAYIFGHENSRDFASSVLEQVASLLRMDRGIMYCRPIADGDGVTFDVAAATGDYVKYLGTNDERSTPLPETISRLLSQSLASGSNVYAESHCVLHFSDSSADENLFYVGEVCQLSDWERQLIELFCTNVAIALENVRLNTELRETQREIVHLLADAVETRSRETGNHVKRVSKVAAALAKAYGLSDTEVAILELAAPLHDVGKIGIPDEILNKPGKHDPDEWEVMQTHTTLGWELLNQSQKPVIRMAAKIARDHHENWDGSGYPEGRQAQDISIPGRIVAVADVFDALGSERCYKEAWEAEDIREYFTDQRGKKFDPELVDLLFAHWDDLIALREVYPD